MFSRIIVRTVHDGFEIRVYQPNAYYFTKPEPDYFCYDAEPTCLLTFRVTNTLGTYGSYNGFVVYALGYVGWNKFANCVLFVHNQIELDRFSLGHSLEVYSRRGGGLVYWPLRRQTLDVLKNPWSVSIYLHLQFLIWCTIMYMYIYTSAWCALGGGTDFQLIHRWSVVFRWRSTVYNSREWVVDMDEKGDVIWTQRLSEEVIYCRAHLCHGELTFFNFISHVIVTLFSDDVPLLALVGVVIEPTDGCFSIQDNLYTISGPDITWDDCMHACVVWTKFMLSGVI